jgi:hypothetical protein
VTGRGTVVQGDLVVAAHSVRDHSGRHAMIRAGCRRARARLAAPAPGAR